MAIRIADQPVGSSFETPCFLLSKNKLETRLRSLRSLAQQNSITLLAAAKAIPWEAGIPDLVAPLVAGFDVSNLRELSRYKRKFPKHIFSYSSPFDSIPEVLTQGSMVNASTHSQFERVLCDPALGIRKGIRIKADECGDYVSRFGLSPAEVTSIVRAKDLPIPTPMGIHVHSGSRLNTIPQLLQRVSRALQDCNSIGLSPDYLNIGGGFSRLTVEQFGLLLRIVRSLVQEADIIIEPGDFLFSGAVVAYASVRDVRRSSEGTAVVTDISSEAHLRWSTRVETSSAEVQGSKNIGARICQVFGPTCFERDFIGNLDLGAGLDVSEGDVLEISGISSYSIVWNAEFNGIEKAKIYMLEDV